MRMLHRFAVLSSALLVMLAVLLGNPGTVRAQAGTEDLGSSAELQHRKLVEDYEARIRALFAQSAFRETAEFCDRLLAIDADNNVATFYKERAEASISGAAPVQRPVRSLPRTPSAMPTPVPLAQGGGFSGGDGLLGNLMNEANRTMLIILVSLLLLLIVVAIVAFVMLRRSREQYQKALSSASNPTMGGTSLGGLHDMVTSVGYEPKALADHPTLPEEEAPPAPHRAAPEAPPSRDPSFLAVGGLQSSEHIALDVGPAPVPRSNEMEIGEFSGSEMDPSDSQMSDVEVTQGDTFSSPPARPFAPPAPLPVPVSNSGKSSEMALPPISSEVGVGADSFAATAHVPPISAGDDPFAVAPPVASGARGAEPDPFAADPFAGPPPPQAAAAPEQNDLTFNSLMFGGGGSTEPPPAAPNDELSLGSFNDQFSDVMLGPGTDDTGVAPVSQVFDIHEEKTMLGVPGFGNPEEGTIGLEGYDQPAPKKTQSTDEATVNITPKKDARPAAGGSVGASMFDRQLAAGKEAFAEGDFAKAVQCLSVAASLRPADKELRDLLEQARAKRK